jgi:dienelactone hydrolase
MLAIARRAAAGIDAERGVSLSLQVHENAAPHVARAAAGHDLEFTSRGDRVPASLWLPEPRARASAPLVCLQPGAGGRIDDAHLHAVSALLEAGLAVATLDWPLHGRRASPKLTGRLLEALDAEEPGPDAGPLVEQFVVQSAIDLSRLLDAAAAIEEVDGSRIALVGLGLGAHLTALVASLDERPGALVLAPTLRGTAPRRLEAASLLAGVRTASVLLLASRETPAVPASEVEALRQACPTDARIEWVNGSLEPLSASATEAVAKGVAQALA